jgi:hypothetical protein
VRFEIRVKPRARADHVGGTWGPDDALVVAVQAPAVDGRANAAAADALAEALAVPRRSVRIVRGDRHRTKLIELTDPPDGIAARLADLRHT